MGYYVERIADGYKMTHTVASEALAEIDFRNQVERLAEAGSVYVRRHKHLRVIEKRAES